MMRPSRRSGMLIKQLLRVSLNRQKANSGSLPGAAWRAVCKGDHDITGRIIATLGSQQACCCMCS